MLQHWSPRWRNRSAFYVLDLRGIGTYPRNSFIYDGIHTLVTSPLWIELIEVWTRSFSADVLLGRVTAVRRECPPVLELGYAAAQILDPYVRS